MIEKAAKLLVANKMVPESALDSYQSMSKAVTDYVISRAKKDLGPKVNAGIVLQMLRDKGINVDTAIAAVAKPVPEQKSEPKPVQKQVPKPEPKLVPKPEPKLVPKPASITKPKIDEDEELKQLEADIAALEDDEDVRA